MILYGIPDPTVAAINVFIIIILILGTVYGFKKEFTENSVKFIGFLIIFFGGYFLKNPISIFLYKNFPFFNFGGSLSGVTVLNIIIYEIIAYIIILILLYIVLKLIFTFTKIIDKILSFILAIGVPSNILGAIITFFETYFILYIVIFMITFVCNFNGFKIEDTLANKIMNTPVLKDTIGKSLNAFYEISELSVDYKDKKKSEEYNYKALDIILKYDIITTDNAKDLLVSGKLNIPNSGKLISKYER